MATIVAMWQITWFSAMTTIVAIGKLDKFSKERLANEMSTSKKCMAAKGLSRRAIRDKKKIFLIAQQ